MGVFFILTFSLMIFVSLSPTTIVLADEAEETDEFLIPPNYRWTNTSTTRGAQEKIDNGYEVYVKNLDGSSYLRKFRELNSRDFFFESRFKVDGANNSEIEYFRDVEEDFCDFYEDTEDWTAFNGSSLALDENTLEVTTITANQGINYSFSANDSYYHLFEFRAKASVSAELNFTFSDVDTHSNQTTIGTEWAVYSFTLGNGTFFNVTENSEIIIQTTTDGEVSFWFDYINLWGQINYFLHYDDEYGSNYIYNGDNEDGDIGQVWGTGADTDHPEWESWQDFPPSAQGFVESGGSTQVFRLKSSTSNPIDTTYKGIKQTQAFDYNEESNYTFSTTMQYEVSGGGSAGKLNYVATKYIFQDAGGVTLGELRPYIASKATGWSNTSTALYFQVYLHTVGGASGYYTFNASLNDVLEDLPALDTVTERTHIAKIQTIEYTYQESGTNVDIEGYWDNTTLSEQADSSGYEDDVWDGVGFRWEILNADFTTGMYIQISNIGNSYSESNYTLDVVFPDEFGGDFWNYSTTFEHDPREWLRIDLGFDIDKVDMKLKVLHDDGRTIARLDVYDIEPTPTVLPPLFTIGGFPSLGMDARVSPMEHCYFSIGFIDANWLLNHWTQPDAWVDATWGVDKTQGSSEYVTQEGIYGTRAEVPTDEGIDEARFWRMDVDRFDGITFDVQIATTCPEGDSYLDFGTLRDTEWHFGIYNVQPDGTLQRIFYLIGGEPAEDYSFNLLGFDSGGTETLTYETDSDNTRGSITKLSFFHEDSTKVTLQARTEIFDTIGNGGDPINEEHSMSQDGLTLTKEYVFYMAYEFDVQVGDEDETTNVDFKVAGMDVTRKDILGQIVGMVLGPLIGFVALLLSPLIFFFQILIFVFRQLIGGLAAVFETVVGGLLTFLDPLFTWLSDILEGLVGIGAAFLQSIIDGLGDLLEDFIDALALLFDVIVEFGAELLFFVWDDFLGLEDFDLLAIIAGIMDIALELIILFIELLLQIPPFIIWIIEVWFFYGWLIFAFFWVLIILVPAMSGDTKSPMDWVDRMLNRMMWNVSPGSITLIGITAGVEIAQGFWDGAWDMFNVYVGLENAFYITMVLILTVSVYIILQRFVVNK